MYQQSAGKSALNYASEGMEDVGSPEVKAAYDKVMEAIMVGSGEGTEEIPNKHNTYYRYHPSFKQAVETLGLEKAIQVGAEKIKSQYAKYDYDFYKRYGYSDTDIEKRKEKDKRNMKKAINEMSQEMAYHHENLTGTKIDNIKIPNGKSKYFEDSSHAGGSIAYYTSKCEMFARAFENYIEGKMKSGKVKNDYLTHGTWINGENEGIRFMGQLFPDIKVPYPCGKERDMIHAAFDGLIGAIRKAGAIKKGLSFDMMKSAQPVEGRLSYFGQVFIDNYKPEDVRRCAYRVDWISFDEDIESVFYIPINRLKTDYQTSEALNFDKIRENVEKMKEGVALEPIVIGYDYDVHDGHHRIEASKIMNFTHVPCVVRGNNDIEVQRAKEAYAEVWKSFNEVEHPRDSVGRFTDKDGQDKDPKITEVYHFTRDKDFKYDPNYKNTKQEMGAGLYTAPLDDAMYWHRALQDKNGSRHKYAIPIDVSEAKLVHTDDIPYDLHELAKHLIKHYGSPKEALKHVDEEEEGISGEIFGNDPSLIAQRRLYAKTKGYDGIIMHDDREGIQVILFNSDHVKFKPAITADDLFEEKKRKDFPFLNMKSLNIVNADSLQKSITRAEAKNLHKDLPPGGVWRTMHGHHIYIKDGKVLAGAVPGVTKTRKATKAELKEHQAAVDKEAVQKNKKPVYNKDVEPKKADNKKKGAELYVRANKGEPSETGKAGRKTAKDQRADNRTDDKGRVQQRGSGGTGQSVLVEYKKAKPKEFHSAIAAAKANNDHGAFVDLHDEEDYKKDKLLLSPGGGSGCAIESNGNIVSAFKDPKSNEQGAMHHILINALKNGGDRLDCYDGFLPKAYAQHGFIPVARLKFNREYASPDWNYERDGEPDVVFMAHNGDSIDTIQDKVGSYPMPDMSKVPYVDDYDAGVKMRNDYIDGIKNTSEGVQKKEKPLYINNEKEQSSQNKNKEVSGMKEEFSVFNSSSAKNKYLKVKGSSVELNDGVKAFVYKKKDGGYSVCELVSGSTLVSAAKTPEAAIDFANNLIKTKGSRIKSEIVNHIQNYGMAPSTGTGAEENLTKLSRQEINERFRQLDTKLESESKAKYDPQLEELKKQEKATRLKLDEAYKMRRSKKRDALTEELDKNIEDILRKQNQVFREKMEYQQQGKDNSDIGKEYRRRNEIGNREIDGSLLPEEEKELDKELGAKPFNANASDEYFYRHNSDGWDSRAVSAKPIDLGHGIEGFVVSNKNYSELNVYEAKTGLRLTTDYPYDSSVSNEERLRRAANRAKLKIRDIPKGDALNEGSSIDNFKNKIADIVKQNGMSPRYNEDGTAKSSKQAVAKPTVPKEEKPFYIYKRLEDGSKGFAAVEGKKVKIADGLDTFTHKIGSRYTITEARSGLAFATDMPTREAAISKAKEIIDSYGIEKIKTMMEDAVGRQGLSPRYKD
jgi:hypothetical protein